MAQPPKPKNSLSLAFSETVTVSSAVAMALRVLRAKTREGGGCGYIYVCARLPPHEKDAPTPRALTARCRAAAHPNSSLSLCSAPGHSTVVVVASK